MRRILLAAVVLLAGCVAPGQVDSGAVLPTLERYCARHDAYVEADTTLSVLERRTHLRDSALLLQIHREAVAAGREP